MSNKTTVHIGTLHAKPEQVENLIKSFEGLKQASGYISHECYRDIHDKNKLTLVEQWESKDDHENFVKSFPEEVMEQWLNMLSKEGEDSYYERL
jgi:quinol monooxygenase YgiN